MEKLIKTKREAFDAICYVIKALALFFCFYPLFDVFFKYSPRDSMNQVSMQSMITSFFLLLLLLGIWLILQPNREMKPWRKRLEIMVFYVICFASIVASGAGSSDYKFMFVFMVVTYTIQYGLRYGLMITLAAGVTLLGMDFVTMRIYGTGMSFQSDLALTIMLGVISYILGKYAKLEQEHIEELMRMANFDGLTDLYNHRYFHEEMEKQWAEASKKKKNLSLLILDIDYFKMYNDICGHQRGDQVLSRIAQLIRENVRPGDIACRYGGEEFAVIMPGANAEEAVVLAEKLRNVVLDEKISGEEYLPGQHLTISLGAAACQADDVGYSDMVVRADSALYRAKYLRKNRVEQYYNVFDRFNDLDEKTKDALLSIKGLVGIINVRDDYTYSHTERVVSCCEVVAKAIGLSEADTRTLLISAYMHDIGKINVPREVLIAGHKLNEEEWKQIKHHPEGGQAILNQIAGMEQIGEIVAQHHERYDGQGYPKGLSGGQIHPLAALLALADSFDAMTNNRPYQKKRSYEDALEEICKCSGKQFDPKYAELFVRAIRAEIGEGEKSENMFDPLHAYQV